MRHTRKAIILLFCTVALLISCSERQEYIEMLSRAEAVMDDHPDSALTILDSLSIHEKEFSNSVW